MQVKLLELLEGLPEEVQIALLELAYEKALKKLNPCALFWCDEITKANAPPIYVIRYIVAGGETDTVCGAHPKTSELEAWKQAYETIKGQ